VGISVGTEEPHALGLKVEFCKLDGVWFGFIIEYTGFVADPPTAALESLQLSESTGRVDFTTLLTTGMMTRPGATDVFDMVPATSRYEFSGRIERNAMVGVMTRTPADGSRRDAIIEEVTLSLETPTVSESSCAQWKQLKDQIVIFRSRMFVPTRERR
jgi:hypothetical protein